MGGVDFVALLAAVGLMMWAWGLFGNVVVVVFETFLVTLFIGVLSSRLSFSTDLVEAGVRYTVLSAPQWGPLWS